MISGRKMLGCNLEMLGLKGENAKPNRNAFVREKA